MGYFGDDVGELTLDDPLFAAGKIALPRFSVDSGMHVGWFSSREQRWPPRSFIGAYLDSYSAAGRFITPMYGSSGARLERGPERAVLHGAKFGPQDILFFPDGRSYDWSIQYHPQAAGGSGAITLTLGAQSTTLALDPAARREGAVMDRFGVFNMQDNNWKDCLFYLDDLRYTTAERKR